MRRLIAPLCLFLGLGLPAVAVHAEDIDIFKARDQQQVQINVLIVVDNTANWGQTADWAATASCSKKDSKFCYEKEALASTIASTNIEGLNIGMLLFTESGESPDGAYPRYAMRPMGIAGSSNNANLVSLVASLDKLNDKGSNAAIATSMHETYLYFQGKRVYAGITSKSDAGTIKLGNGSTIVKSDGGAFTSFTLSPKSGVYKKGIGISSSACDTKNFVIYLSNGPADNSEDGTALSLLTADGGFTTQIPLTPSGSQNNWADEFARFMYASSGIQVFTIDVAPNTTGQGPGHSALLESMARQSNGAYYRAVNSEILNGALKEVLDQIQAVNRTFAPAALPGSSLARGVSLNQLYLGMFRPDKNPRWFGNLKLYQYGIATDDQGKEHLTIIDSNGAPVKNPDPNLDDGFVDHPAVSFWTTPSTFWNFRCTTQSGVPLTEADPLKCGKPVSGSDSPDGGVVEKGGAGQLLRGSYASRTVYTTNSDTANNSLLPVFDSSNSAITTSLLGAADSTERAAIISWAKGLDNITENGFVANGPRPSIRGDVLHSAPAAVSYNGSASSCSDNANLDTDVVVFSASNNGMLHASRGGKTGTNVGQELWSFIPYEFLPKLRALRRNEPPIIFPAPVPAGAQNKPYMIDGNLSVYAPDDNRDCKPDKVWLYLTMRRGGRFMYALDVTNKTAPKLLWKKSNSDSGFAELGQTWSELKPMRLTDGTPALIFGAGYDAGAEDIPYQTSTDTYGFPAGQSAAAKSMGRGVYVVNASNGSLIKLFSGIQDSVPSAVAVVRNALTDVAERAYVGDTGGNVWRIGFLDSNGQVTSDPSKWSIFKLAALGNGTPLSADDRKFLFEPDVVPIDGSYAIQLGSGDREKPFEKVVQNRFYSIRDRSGNSTITCLTDAASGDNSSCVANGWYRNLTGTGEKTVASAVTDSGVTFFPTNTPPNYIGDECTVSLGIAKMYQISFDTGGPEIIAGVAQPLSETLSSGGFAPPPRVTTVPITQTKNGVTETKLYTGVIAPPSFQATRPSPPSKRSIVFQYKEGLD